MWERQASPELEPLQSGGALGASQGPSSHREPSPEEGALRRLGAPWVLAGSVCAGPHSSSWPVDRALPLAAVLVVVVHRVPWASCLSSGS